AAGDAWSKRSAADEWDDASLRAGTDRFASALRRIGVAPRFVSDAQVAGGALHGLRALILPDVLALSPEAAAAIRGFAAQGGLVIAEGETGRFDAHGRRLLTSPVAGLPSHRLAAADVTPDRLRSLLADAGVRPAFRLLGPDGRTASDVDAYARADGGQLILALQSAHDGGAVVLALPHPRMITDLLASKKLGRTDRLSVALDPAVPTLLAVGQPQN
ncbi:MAG TPA: hypothetical protein VIZ17_10845, partial [Acetobacteraceae bacterium]